MTAVRNVAGEIKIAEKLTAKGYKVYGVIHQADHFLVSVAPNAETRAKAFQAGTVTEALRIVEEEFTP